MKQSSDLARPSSCRYGTGRAAGNNKLTDRRREAGDRYSGDVDDQQTPAHRLTERGGGHNAVSLPRRVAPSSTTPSPTTTLEKTRGPQGSCCSDVRSLGQPWSATDSAMINMVSRGRSRGASRNALDHTSPSQDPTRRLPIGVPG